MLGGQLRALYSVSGATAPAANRPSSVITTEKALLASSRPLTWQEMQLLQEGERSDHFRVINCDDELFAADDKQQVAGDIIVGHLGNDWRVIASMRWGDGHRHNSYKIQKFQQAAP